MEPWRQQTSCSLLRMRQSALITYIRHPPNAPVETRTARPPRPAAPPQSAATTTTSTPPPPAAAAAPPAPAVAMAASLSVYIGRCRWIAWGSVSGVVAWGEGCRIDMRPWHSPLLAQLARGFERCFNTHAHATQGHCCREGASARPTPRSRPIDKLMVRVNGVDPIPLWNGWDRSLHAMRTQQHASCLVVGYCHKAGGGSLIYNGSQPLLCHAPNQHAPRAAAPCLCPVPHIPIID